MAALHTGTSTWPIRRLRVGAIGWLVALGFVLRLVWVLAVPSRPVGDFALYRESAAYLVEHGALDPEFIYMPGYVFLLAAVDWLGGGLVAAKMIGVAAGTAITFACAGIAEQLFDRRAGIVAAALGALWPAGIAVTSVTGTDLPAGALVALAVWALVRSARARPWWAAALCGLILGLGAWIRAVAVPLAALSFFYWWAVETRWRLALARTAVAVLAALVVLLPWGLRNRHVYGELFLTDSHGGHTALVGANPNSEGTYSRSLNLMFTRATGYRLTDAPARHRASDRAAYALAKRWSAFEPAYAVGLLAAKADRLLSHERNLLYWPIFRQGVLPASARAFEDAHRTALERIADGFWYGIVGLFVAGVTLVWGARDRRPLALLAFPAAMVAIYASFFSEVRYHLAIAPLLFPLAAFGLTWVGASARRRFLVDGARNRWSWKWTRAVLAVGAVYAGWNAMLVGGAALRARHRWGVALCAYPTAGETQLCAWERLSPRGGPAGPSPVRGAWDGVGLVVTGAAHVDVLAAARTRLPLDRGRYRLRAWVQLVEPPRGASVALSVSAGQIVIARALLPVTNDSKVLSHDNDARIDSGLELGAGSALAIEGVFDHEGGEAVLDAAIEAVALGSNPEGGAVWISKLIVERFPPSEIIPRR